MPLIRCPKCGQAYDVPGAIAVRLPNSIATCHCGEWLSGSKAAVLARMGRPEDLRQVDLQPYRVDQPVAAAQKGTSETEPEAPTAPRSLRVIARGAKDSFNRVFTISQHPLWIGRKGCHVELADSDLDIRHCSISVHGANLVIRDADSHMGTYLDGQQIDEVVIEEGVHLLRVGTALVSIEPTDEQGEPVERLELKTDEILSDSSAVETLRARAKQPDTAEKRMLLVCIDGALNGQEFEIPPTGLIVGREGHVRVPDEFLSRKHFEVFLEADGTIRVRDLGSRNGTFLNTLPARNTKVQSGDEIRAGVNRFRVELR